MHDVLRIRSSSGVRDIAFVLRVCSLAPDLTMNNSGSVPTDAGNTIGLGVLPAPLSCPHLRYHIRWSFRFPPVVSHVGEGLCDQRVLCQSQPRTGHVYGCAGSFARRMREAGCVKPGWHVALPGGLLWSDEDGYAAVHLAPSLRHSWPAHKMNLRERKRSSSLTMMKDCGEFLSLTAPFFVFSKRDKALKVEKSGGHFASLVCEYWEVHEKKFWE